jgi:3-hydroxyacyl-[acyl-carrier-protein] dehydratase
MLLGNFYQLVTSRREDDIVFGSIIFNADHAIFKGHFPHLPIVPGVCQLQIMEEIISHVLGKNMRLKRAAQIKFLSFVNPNVQPRLDVILKIVKQEGPVLFVEGRCVWEETIFLKFKGEFGDSKRE